MAKFGSPGCPICSGTGYWRVDLPLGHPEFGKVHVCTCHTGLRTQYLEQCGLDERQRQYQLKDVYVEGFPGHARTRQALEEFVARPIGMVTIWGRSGNGKTLATQAAVAELVRAGVQAAYVRAPALIICMRQALFPSGDVKNGEAHHRLTRLQEARILAIDDFDRAYDNRAGHEQIEALLERRYELGTEGLQGTILVMNTDPAGLQDWLASRIFDGRNRVVHNDDPDLRRAMRP